MGTSHKRLEPFFIGGVDPLRHHVKIFIWQLEEGYHTGQIYETNFSVSVKYHTTRKVQFQFLNSFLLVLTKFSFWEEGWALDYNSMKI